jgi:hypothetical protein
MWPHPASKAIIGGVSMKTLWVATAILVAGFVSGPSPAQTQEPVGFPDPALERQVRLCIDRPEGGIFTGDLESIKRFKAAEAGISDLTGIENMVNLEELDLRANSIVDVEPLGSLTKLKLLDLGAMDYVDVWPWEGKDDEFYMIDSTYFLAYWGGTYRSDDGNSISDISPISRLASLEHLDLSCNYVSDLSALSSLKNLRTLDMSFNEFSNLEPITGLTNLSCLNLIHCGLEDIGPLSRMTGLTYVGLGVNRISDISALRGLTSLDTVHLEMNTISDLTPLVENPGIGRADLIDVRGNGWSVKDNEQVKELEDRGVRFPPGFLDVPIDHW